MRMIVVISMVLALGLGACGRRGALEPPPEGDQPEKASKTFVLDGLIKRM